MNRLSDGFIGIQLELVERHVALGLGSWGSGIGRLTNLRRRLGLSDDRHESTWRSLLRDADDLAALDPIAARLGAARDELPAPTPEHLRHGWPTCGAFSIQVEGDAARTHFFATDEDEVSVDVASASTSEPARPAPMSALASQPLKIAFVMLYNGRAAVKWQGEPHQLDVIGDETRERMPKGIGPVMFLRCDAKTTLHAIEYRERG